ncbi:iron export ABC transporter permease subunit FetB [Providencia alcalifaciens]|nr:iron export ABC transporter permease subunit FetB [Providencia rettgeri]QLR06269.1 iron export ABC transporter permease subunit FetB [Providencia rettgeri]HEQ1856591.1 iron export ABC transporter permease subunit FetB [Providencia alcalifaciens]
MHQPTISNESLAFSIMLVLVAIFISHKEKLSLEKDIIWSTCRAIVQLLIAGYILKYIFHVDHKALTVLLVLFICFNAAWNAKKRSKYLDKLFPTALIAITSGTFLTLLVLILTEAIAFTPMQVIPITGMIAGNAMIAVGLCFNNLGQRFNSQQQQIQEMLSLGATPKIASASIIRESIRASLIPTVDSAKTVGIVSLPGMMSGLIFAGVDPLQAVKYQIMVTFMLLATASLSTILAGYLTYVKFYNQRHQLRLDALNKNLK